MTADERAAFERLPLAGDAVRLRRADEMGKIAGLEVGGLDEWMGAVRRVHARVA
jgi:predicted HD phosphohydrolase